MGFHGVVVASLAVMAGCAVGGARAQEAASEKVRAEQPAVNAAAETPEEIRARKYPVDRDYRRERLDLIIQAAGGRGHNTENGWSSFVSAVSQVSGVLTYALEFSPVKLKWEEANPGESMDGQEMIWAAAGERPGVAPELAEEGARVIAQFLGSPLAKRLDLLGDEKRFFPPIDAAEPAVAIMLPYLGDSRGTARFNAGRMVLAWSKGDDKEFLRAARANCAVSRACGSDPLTIAHLVATAIDALTMTRAMELNLRKPLSAEVCRGMLALSDAYPGPNFEVSMRGEGLYCLDTLNWVYTKGSIKDIMGEPADTIDAVKAAAKRAMWVSREAALEQADQFFTAMSKVFDADQAVAETSLATITAVQKRIADDTIFQVTYQPLVMLIPSMERVIQVEKQSRSFHGAMRVILAAELYKHEHGVYPQSMDDLLPTIGTAPRDWFSAGDRAIQYKRVDPATDRLGRSYLVYSVGRDGVDNAGAENQEQMYAAIGSVNHEGLDLVFNWRDQREVAK